MVFSRQHSSRIVQWIVALSCVATLLYAFAYRIAPEVDARAYDTIAMNIVTGHGFREDTTQSYQYDTAILRAGPGYEFFLAGLYRVFGHHYEVVWVVQALLHAVSVYLVYWIARETFRNTLDSQTERAAIIAAILFGFWPDLIEIAAMLMTETLYLFCILFVVYAFVQVYRAPQRLPMTVALGLATGLAIMTRPTVILFVPCILFFYYRAKEPRGAGLYVVSLLVTLAPWVTRNYILYHQILLTTLIGGYNLWIGNTLLADGGQISGGFNPVTTYGATYGWLGFSQAARQAFITFVVTHPFTFIKLCAIRLVTYFSLIRPMGFWFYQTGVKQAMFVLSSALWIAGVFVTGWTGVAMVGANLFRDIRQQLQRHGPQMSLISYLSIFALSAPLPLLLTVVESRYRFQVYPFLALFAGYAIVQFQKSGSSWWKQRAWLGSVGCLLMATVVDAVMSMQTIVDHLTRLFL